MWKIVKNLENFLKETKHLKIKNIIYKLDIINDQLKIWFHFWGYISYCDLKEMLKNYKWNEENNKKSIYINKNWKYQ